MPSLPSRLGGSGYPWRLRIGIWAGIFLLVIFISSAGYQLIEPEFSWLDSIYMTVITVATVGYQEVHPLAPAGRAWTMFVIVGGLTSGTVTLSLVAARLIESQVRSIFGRRHLERRISALSGHVIVCGYGNMGALVAQELTQAGKDVVVIDRDEDRTAAAQEQGLLYVYGDAQDEEVLARAGVRQAATVVAALAHDAENVFVTLSVREMNPSAQIVARAEQASTQDKLRKAGASRVVCPKIIGASRVTDVVLRPAVVDFVEMAHKGIDLEMDQLVVSPGSPLAGKTLPELSLPRRVGVQVVAIRRATGQAVYHPTSELRLTEGDVLILVGRKGAAAAVQKLQAEGGGRAQEP